MNMLIRLARLGFPPALSRSRFVVMALLTGMKPVMGLILMGKLVNHSVTMAEEACCASLRIVAPKLIPPGVRKHPLELSPRPLFVAMALSKRVKFVMGPTSKV